MNRRQFIFTAATAATVARNPDLIAATAKYDLIIKGGRVVDPARKLDAIRDIAIADGRIAAIQANVSAGRGGNDRCAAANWWCPA